MKFQPDGVHQAKAGDGAVRGIVHRGVPPVKADVTDEQSQELKGNEKQRLGDQQLVFSGLLLPPEMGNQFIPKDQRQDRRGQGKGEKPEVSDDHAQSGAEKVPGHLAGHTEQERDLIIGPKEILTAALRDKEDADHQVNQGGHPAGPFVTGDGRGNEPDQSAQRRAGEQGAEKARADQMERAVGNPQECLQKGDTGQEKGQGRPDALQGQPPGPRGLWLGMGIGEGCKIRSAGLCGCIHKRPSFFFSIWKPVGGQKSGPDRGFCPIIHHFPQNSMKIF